jgi:hypothetical protein
MSTKQHIDLKEIAGLFPRSRPHLFQAPKSLAFDSVDMTARYETTRKSTLVRLDVD